MPTRPHARHAEHLADYTIRSLEKESLEHMNKPTALYFLDRIIKKLTRLRSDLEMAGKNKGASVATRQMKLGSGGASK